MSASSTVALVEHQASHRDRRRDTRLAGQPELGTEAETLGDDALLSASLTARRPSLHHDDAARRTRRVPSARVGERDAGAERRRQHRLGRSTFDESLIRQDVDARHGLLDRVGRPLFQVFARRGNELNHLRSHRAEQRAGRTVRTRRVPRHRGFRRPRGVRRAEATRRRARGASGSPAPSARSSPPTSRSASSNRRVPLERRQRLVLLRGGSVRRRRAAAPGQGAEHQQDRPRHARPRPGVRALHLHAGAGRGRRRHRPHRRAGAAEHVHLQAARHRRRGRLPPGRHVPLHRADDGHRVLVRDRGRHARERLPVGGARRAPRRPLRKVFKRAGG